MVRQRGVTLRTYLAVRVMDETGCTPAVAIEAVTSTWLDKPEPIPLNERRTWQEWTDYFADLEKGKG